MLYYYIIIIIVDFTTLLCSFRCIVCNYFWLNYLCEGFGLGRGLEVQGLSLDLVLVLGLGKFLKSLYWSWS